jgi:phage terminase large subunit-like protein
MSSASHIEKANGYIRDVLSGDIPACKWVRLACERQLRDIKASKGKSYPYRFDEDKGERACRFIENVTHTKGEWARQKITLEPWQSFIISTIFGWVKKSSGYRRFRKARLYVPRKNGKSIFASAIGLMLFRFDNEPGAEVYCGATSEKQANEVFKPARQMCLNDSRLVAAKQITVNAASLVCEGDGSKFETVIGKPGDGASPHCAITDEYHEHKTDDMIATMETGMGARRQPLSIVTSTAGSNLAGPCREDWKMCEGILENTGGFEDESVFCIIYTIDQEDEWDSELAIRKANPNLGVSVYLEYIQSQLNAAKQLARLQSSFKTKHLNQWVAAKNAYYNSEQWQNLGNPDLKREDFKQYPCILASDYASKHDLVAMMQLFILPDKKYALFGKYYLPEATINLPENQHYRTWKAGGWIEETGGEITDLQAIIEDAAELCREYDVEEMPSDPNRAWGVFTDMQKLGIPVVEYRNTVLTMSEPMKELDAWIRSGAIVHCGDPVLAWAISNVTGKEDKKENVYPNKEDARSKIDPVVASLFAIGRAMTRPEAKAKSFFAF